MTKKMSLEEFRSSGLLQEVNRLFFHPRGLAIGIRVTATGDTEFDGIWDHRDDPEGLVFPDLTSDEARDKAARVWEMARDKADARIGIGLLGEVAIRHAPGDAVIQPIGTKLLEETRHDD